MNKSGHRCSQIPPARAASSSIFHQGWRFRVWTIGSSGMAPQSMSMTKTLLLTSRVGKKASFSFARARQNQLTLDGEMESHKIHMELRLVEPTNFLLFSRGFHWTQESAFNR